MHSNNLFPLLFTKERPEQFAQVTHHKRVIVSDSLISLFKKEQKCDSLKKKERESHSRSFTHQKMSDLLEKPMSEFPTLGIYGLQKADVPITT